MSWKEKKTGACRCRNMLVHACTSAETAEFSDAHVECTHYNYQTDACSTDAACHPKSWLEEEHHFSRVIPQFSHNYYMHEQLSNMSMLACPVYPVQLSLIHI